MHYEEDNFYIDEILKGDSSAFALLVDKHKSMAYNIAFRILKNREDAEEIAQDSFLKAYYSLKEFKRESKFSTWIFRIIYNNSISRIRKKKLEINSYDDESFEWLEPIEATEELDKLHHLEQKKYINQALSKLAADEVTIVSLFYLNENSIEEIGEVTGLSQSNIKVKLFRARKKLHEELQQLLKKEVNEIV